MSYIVILSVFLGGLFGYNFIPQDYVKILETVSTVSLNLILLSVGLDIGGNKNLVKDLKQNGIKILIIPFAIIIGSLIGGIVASFICKLPLKSSLSISSGMGWYSLTSIMLTTLDCSKVGTVAFISNMLRELIAIVIVPYVAKTFNGYSTIAPAAANSMDTVLPMILKETESKVAIAAFVNGIVLMPIIPLIITFIYSF